jgi:hypothetical protein
MSRAPAHATDGSTDRNERVFRQDRNRQVDPYTGGFQLANSFLHQILLYFDLVLNHGGKQTLAGMK